MTKIPRQTRNSRDRYRNKIQKERKFPKSTVHPRETGTEQRAYMKRQIFCPKSLTFACWCVHPEIVAENLKEFEDRHFESVKLAVIDEPYEPKVRAALMSAQPFDLFYAQRGEASRWYSMGLIRPIDDLPGFRELIQLMSPNIVDDSTSLDGRFLGLTYYNGGPFCLFRNERLLSAAGIEPGSRKQNYPRNWEEVYRQARALRRKKIATHPILMSWHNAHNGLPWNLLAQSHAEGEDFVDQELRATFGSSSPLEKVLTDWKQWWMEELVPRESLMWNDSEVRQAWMQGSHAFHPTLDYHIASYNNPSLSAIAPFNNLNPFMPGATGQTSLIGHPFVCLSNRPRSESDLLRAWKLAKFLGGTDRPGEFYVHRKWVRTSNFEVPFPLVYDDPACRAAILGWMYPPIAEHAYAWMFSLREIAQATPVMRAPWYLDWAEALHVLVKDELLIKRSQSPTAICQALRKRWDILRAEFLVAQKDAWLG